MTSTSTPDDPVIVTRGLSKSFRGPRGTTVDAVRDVSISVGRGEIFGFLGPNGAGKTTSLRMLTTLLPIGGGSARVAGFDVATRPQQVRERIGYVSQLGGADDLATGRENLVLQGRLYGGELDAVRTRADEVMGLLDLGEFADRKVRTYSGGQRRRLDVALGIIHRPEVLFLDEPSTGLDPQNRAHLWDHVRQLRDGGATVFLTTHYLEEADALCDRLVIMDHGEIVVEGTPRVLKHEVAGQSVVLTLHDPGADGTRTVTLLDEQPFVHEVGIEAATVRCYVDQGGDELPAILRLLDRARVGVQAMAVSEPTLDDVFLAHTGRSLRDTGAGVAA